jgi:ABC-type branched-subunit amino acid transport system substrate-binding protein
MRHLRLVPLLFLLLFILVLPAVTAQEQVTITIGVLDDPRGALGDGARLAVREINDAGGILSAEGTIIRLELLVQPSAVAIPVALDVLSAADVSAILGPAASEDVLNYLTDLERLDVPILTPATGDTLLTSDPVELLFRSRASESMQGQALAAYLIEQFNLRRIATVQLDLASTGSLLGFATAATTLGVDLQPQLVLGEPEELDALTVDLLAEAPEVVVAYGSPALAAALYTDLRDTGWEGLFVFNAARDPGFLAAVPAEHLSGVLSAMTWAFTATDVSSVNFLNTFIRTYGDIPGELEAAGYDSIRLLAEALALARDLPATLLELESIVGVQGELNPAELGNRELSNNVTIAILNEFGAPEVLARYAGAELLPPPTTIAVPEPTPTPPTTATPEGVTVTVTSTRQNVRSGPGMEYLVLGQLAQGEQEAVLGRSIDSQWVVIDFMGEQGWLNVPLLSVFGDINSVPVIAPPGLPVPGATATPVVTAEADVIIQSVSSTPPTLVVGESFTIVVNVRNIGAGAAGTFTIAGTFPPTNTLLTAVVPGLPPGGSASATMNGILTSTGTYTVAMIIDANNQVFEGSVGELNNTYNFTYTVDRRVLRAGSQTLNLGDTVDLEGNAAQGDANWNADGGLALDAIFGARLGVIGAGDFNTVSYDQINPAVINRDSIPRAELNPGVLLGIITADGNRGVMRVDNVSDTQLGLSFRVFSG